MGTSVSQKKIGKGALTSSSPRWRRRLPRAAATTTSLIINLPTDLAQKFERWAALDEVPLHQLVAKLIERGLRLYR